MMNMSNMGGGIAEDLSLVHDNDHSSFGDEAGPEDSFGREGEEDERSGVTINTSKSKDNGENSTGDVVWKSLMVLLLSLIGLAAGFAFIYGLISRDQEVTEKYYEYAEHIKLQSQAKASQVYAEFVPMNFHLTSIVGSTASTHADNVTWPFVTLPDFAGIIESFATMSGIELVAMAPLVSEAQHEAWEDYSVRNQQWTHPELDHDINEDLATTRRRRKLHSEQEDENSTIPTHIFTRDLEYDPEHKKEYRRDEKGPGPFAPLWQMYPVPSEFTAEDRDWSPVNYNILSHPSLARAVKAVQETGEAVLTEPLHLFEIFGIHWAYAAREHSERHHYNHDKSEEGTEELLHDPIDEPRSIIVSPVYKTFSPTHKELVAFVLHVVQWKNFFEHLLPEGDDGLVLVLQAHKCGRNFTFQVNGKESEFLGWEDLHDDGFGFFDSTVEFSPFVSLPEEKRKTHEEHMNGGGYCHYDINVYPSDTFYQAYQSDIPRIFAAAQVGIFIFVCSVLMLYNWFAMRQESRIQEVVKRSAAIVEKFFPSEVRDRLMADKEEDEDDDNNKKVSLLPRKASRGAANKEDQVAVHLNRENNGIAFQGKPIATLFPQCTVMFAQITGFNAWSAQRSPEDVFILLESTWREFDALTKARGVFKVETIGDCYLAVTGLPEPQKDHAYIMARFARSCMMKMTEVMSRLQSTLGPETTDLKLMVGLNSGPVTAGVLRGQKTSHFQLFGDTVNTASRMESTGQAGRIQMSAETAAYLEQSGSSRAKSWLSPREDLVEAKGKGKLQTWWLETITESSDGSTVNKSVTSTYSDESQMNLMRQQVNGSQNGEMPNSSRISRSSRS